jgi:hypothetical protein
MSDDVVVQFRWEVGVGEEREAQRVVDELSDRGEVQLGEAGGERALAFLPLIAGAVGVLALAESVVKFARRRQAEHRADAERDLGGWIVDARNSPVEVTRSPEVPYPTIIVVGKDGEKVEIDSSLAEDQQTTTIAELLKAAVAAAS